jgi:hypothetical protein
MKFLLKVLCITFSLFWGPLHARTLDDVDVILIRGYSPNVLFNASMPKYGDPQFNSFWAPLDDQYWSYFKTTLLPNNKGRVLILPWSSKDRLNQGILRSAVDRISSEMKAGLCANKCIIITHSTGGLVADHLISSALNSKGSAYDYKFIADKIAAVIHLASAGGGSETGALARDVAFGVGCTNSITKTVISWIFKGVECGAGEDSIGVTNDLVPTRARLINGSQFTYTPSLMVAGEGTADWFGPITHMILPGNDDSVVAMHSTCGGNSVQAVDSCSSSVAANGKLTNMVAPSGLYAAHYPWIMTGEEHNDMTKGQNPGARETVVNNIYGNISQVNSSTGFWFLKTNYRRVAYDESQTTAQIIKNYFTF